MTASSRKETDRIYRATHAEAIAANKRAYVERNRDHIRARFKKWAAENKDKMRGYARVYSRKNLPIPTRPCPTTCECCGQPPTVNALHLDHCHETGAFRGWLCMKCNTAIAKLGDNIDGIMYALAYLRLATVTSKTTVPP